MKERPILFSGPMVRAILVGRKTQTRRIVKAPLKDPNFGCDLGASELSSRDVDNLCPYGQSGDRLWVRETWLQTDGTTSIPDVYYRASESEANAKQLAPWRPSIFMPRLASRITLEIEAVRVEKLQDISDSDAIREGIPDYPNFTGDSPVNDYSALWESINGVGSWSANPWVWVITFNRINQ